MLSRWYLRKNVKKIISSSEENFISSSKLNYLKINMISSVLLLYTLLLAFNYEFRKSLELTFNNHLICAVSIFV